MDVDEKLIKHVAEVARLELTNEEIKEFLPQLKEVIDSFSQIQELNTDNVKPSYHAVELKNVTRDDVPKKSLTNEEALKNTKHKKDGYFKGPRVI